MSVETVDVRAEWAKVETLVMDLAKPLVPIFEEVKNEFKVLADKTYDQTTVDEVVARLREKFAPAKPDFDQFMDGMLAVLRALGTDTKSLEQALDDCDDNREEQIILEFLGAGAGNPRVDELFALVDAELASPGAVRDMARLVIGTFRQIAEWFVTKLDVERDPVGREAIVRCLRHMEKLWAHLNPQE